MLKIDGDRMLEMSNEKPGRKIGDTLHALLGEVLDDPGKNTAEYLEKRALELDKLEEAELRKLAEAGREKQATEEAAALKAIARQHRVA